MRSAWLAVLICTAPSIASADDPPRPEGVLLLEAPAELQTHDEPAARRRIEAIDRTLRHLRGPIAHANARLTRATLQAARARHARIAWIEQQIRRHELEDPAARR